MSNEIKQKPKCKLVGTDGNAFALASKVTEVLRKTGQNDKANLFSKELFTAGSYNNLLQIITKYVDIY